MDLFRSILEMAKNGRGRRRLVSRQYRSTPYPLPSRGKALEDMHQNKKCSSVLEKKDWEDATCSVCMEFPHNAVLLLCSSHDKGCRPYMCGTSYRYSNCLDQYKKAYTKMTSQYQGQPLPGTAGNANLGSVSGLHISDEKCEVAELACPLCRGQVKGWTVVEPARKYLNAKKRSCMQDDCSFVGTYKELRKHVKADHPSARPREVDPVLEQKWRRLERERERDDVISTIRSSMPGAMVLGDYVIEGNHHGFTDDDGDDDDDDGDVTERGGAFEVGLREDFFNVLFLLHSIGPAGNVSLNSRLRRLERGYHRTLNEEGSVGIRPGAINGVSSGVSASEHDDDDDEMSRILGHRRRRVLLGRSGRRRRRREANGGR